MATQFVFSVGKQRQQGMRLVIARNAIAFQYKQTTGVDNFMQISSIYTNVLAATLLVAMPAVAKDSVDEAASIAGLPRQIIENIIKTESGGHPYSLNTNSPLGSFRFESRQAASAALTALLRKGYTNLDVGPAQVNLRWHPDLYLKPTDLLNPRKNIIAAGHVLKKNRESGARDLRELVGHYHSWQPVRAGQYADLVLGQAN